MTEINADIIPKTLVDTRGNTVTSRCPPDGDNNGPSSPTRWATRGYDQIKVDAILNPDRWAQLGRHEARRHAGNLRHETSRR